MKKVILLAEDSADDEVLFKRVLATTGIINPITVVRTGDEVPECGEVALRVALP